MERLGQCCLGLLTMSFVLWVLLAACCILAAKFAGQQTLAQKLIAAWAMRKTTSCNLNLFGWETSPPTERLTRARHVQNAPSCQFLDFSKRALLTFSFVISEDFCFFLDFLSDGSIFSTFVGWLKKTLRSLRKAMKTQKSSLISKEKVNKVVLRIFAFSSRLPW